MSVEMFPVRFVIVDNSGSMQQMDGQRLVRTSNNHLKNIRATRWLELADVVNELGEVVTRLGAETHFHLLNPTHEGQCFVLADGDPQGDLRHNVGRAGISADTNVLRRVMATSPTGSTPLTEAVDLVTRLIAPSADKLRAKGQQARAATWLQLLATRAFLSDSAQRLPPCDGSRSLKDEEPRDAACAAKAVARRSPRHT